MLVYIKNVRGEQTVRNLKFFDAIKLRWYNWLYVPKGERAIIRFLF